MVKIIHNLYCGEMIDFPKAHENGFVTVTMTKEGNHSHREMLKYETLGAPAGPDYYFVQRGKRFAANLLDIDDVSFIPEEVINPALDFIQKQYDKGEKVLIHCHYGKSRGPTTTLLFLRKIGEMPYNFKVSEKIFKTLYPKYDPSKGMRDYAKQHWNKV